MKPSPVPEEINCSFLEKLLKTQLLSLFSMSKSGSSQPLFGHYRASVTLTKATSETAHRQAASLHNVRADQLFLHMLDSRTWVEVGATQNDTDPIHDKDKEEKVISEYNFILYKKRRFVEKAQIKSYIIQ